MTGPRPGRPPTGPATRARRGLVRALGGGPARRPAADDGRPARAGPADLVGLAVRRNPRRAHLLVSRLLGKHVPTDPRLVDAAGLALGELVRRRSPAARNVRPTAPARLRDAGGAAGAAAARAVGPDRRPVRRPDGRRHARGPRGAAAPPGHRDPGVVVGFAETATALGQCVADALGAAPVLHSTRAGCRAWGRSGRSRRSTRTRRRTCCSRPTRPGSRATAPLVLVDDELSTGRDRPQHRPRAARAGAPRPRTSSRRWSTCAPPRTAGARAEHAAALGTRIDVVALVAGRGRPAGRRRGPRRGRPSPRGRRRPGARPPEPRPARRRARVDVDWPPGLPETGRHGVAARGRATLLDAARSRRCAAGLARDPGRRRCVRAGRTCWCSAPRSSCTSRCGSRRPSPTQLGPRARVRSSTTTRSPVLAVDDPGYAIRSALTFPAHDDPDDGPGPASPTTSPGLGDDAPGDATSCVRRRRRGGDTPALWRRGGCSSARRRRA